MRDFLRRATAFFLAIAGVLMYYMPAQAAGIFHTASIQPDDSLVGYSAIYTVSALADTADVVQGVRWSFLSSPTENGVAVELTIADNAEITVIGGLDQVNGAWTVDDDAKAGGIIDFLNPDAEDTTADNAEINFTVSGIANPSIVATAANSGCVRATANNKTGICYVRMQTYTDADNGNWTDDSAVDDAFLAFSVHEGTDVSARVVPTIEFTVEGVAAAQSVNGTITSDVSLPETLDFGIMETDTPRILAHDLTVKTNSQTGYDVTARLRLANLTGTYGDEIDPFRVDVNNADGTENDNLTEADWNAPRLWDLSGENPIESAGPWGETSGTETGWFGASTDDADVFGTDVNLEKWAPIQVESNIVMTENVPDPGTTKVRIGYILGVNVNQKADSYTGTLIYSCTPKY